MTPPMNESDTRTRIRVLMAFGELPPHPYEGLTNMERGHRALLDEPCAICQENGPQVSYSYKDGKSVRLHAACDALWRGRASWLSIALPQSVASPTYCL